MKKHLYEIKRLDIPSYLKWWFIQYKFGGTLSEVLENLTSPITLTNALKRKFKIFEIGGNSVQDETPTSESSIPIKNLSGTVDVNVNNKNIFTEFTRTNNDNQYGYKEGNKYVSLSRIGTAVWVTKIDITNIQLLYLSFRNLTNNADFKYLLSNEDVNGSQPIASLVNTNGVLITRNTTITNNGLKYLYIMFRTSENGSLASVEDIILSTEEQTVTFPLSEGQLLHLGDTLEDDGVHQRRFTKVFDGSETFEQFQAWGNYYRARLSMLNAKTFSTNDDNGQLCSHFIYSKSGSLGSEAQANNGSFAQYHDSDKFYFVFEQTSIANFKAWLEQQYANGTPVTLEYELTEPIIVPYTETQQEAYDKIKKLYTYKGITNISSDNNPSPIFKIQYVKEDANESSNND